MRVFSIAVFYSRLSGISEGGSDGRFFVGEARILAATNSKTRSPSDEPAAAATTGTPELVAEPRGSEQCGANKFLNWNVWKSKSKQFILAIKEKLEFVISSRSHS